MAKRRSNGEGSIRKRKDGRWEGRYTIGMTEDGKPIMKNVLAKTQGECKEKLKIAMEQNAGHRISSTSDYTVAEWGRLWLDVYCTDLRPSTWNNYRNYFENHVVGQIGNIKLRKLTTAHLQEMYNFQREYGRAKVLSDGNTGLSVRTVQGIHLMLHCCFEQAVVENIIPKNPCDNCRLPKKERKEMKFIPPEKVGAYLRAAESEGVLPMFYLELSTGLRRGELLALLWEDVDRENSMISVTKQVTRVNGELVVSQPKTPTSVRKVAVSRKTVELLEQEHDHHPDSPYLFPSPVTGGMFSPDSARRIHKRILRKARVDESIRFHDLRHTFTTMVLSGGADPKTISGMLGHTSVDFTMNVYGHFTPQMQRDAAEKVGQIIEK